MPNDKSYQPPKLSGEQTWPEMGRAYHKMTQEMPDAVKGLNKIRPMNWFERNTFSPDTQAITYPNNTVIYNPDPARAVGESPEELLRHELTHVRQNQSYGGTIANALKPLRDLFTSYRSRPDEQEAYDASYRMSRAAARGDIDLPAEGLKRAAR
jgi:hypothetical protein